MIYCLSEVGDFMLKNNSIGMYDFFNNVSVFVLIIFNLLNVGYKKAFLGKHSEYLMKKAKAKGKKLFSGITFWAITETLIVCVFQFAPVLSLNKMFGNLVGTGTNYFGLCFFSPVILITAFLLFAIPPLKQMDLITPAFALTLITIKFACFCDGCCRGIQCTFGLYNKTTGNVEFPVQLVEMALALLIFIFLLSRRKKAKEGTVFPTYLILYCATRFFSEFLREEPNILWIFKKYHLLCIIGVVVGLIELYIVKNHYDKLNLLFDKITETMFQGSHHLLLKLHQLAVKLGIKREKNIVHHKKRKRK